jgi:hypothetical protein
MVNIRNSKFQQMLSDHARMHIVQRWKNSAGKHGVVVLRTASRQASNEQTSNDTTNQFWMTGSELFTECIFFVICIIAL